MRHIVIVTDETTDNVDDAERALLTEVDTRGLGDSMRIYGSEDEYGLVDVNLTVDYSGTTEQLESLLENMFPAPTYSVSITDSWNEEED